MKRFLAFFAVSTLFGSALAQESRPTVEVPSYPNSTCPVMGKPVSLKLYVDTAYGRIYMCCAGCTKRIKADPEAAYKAAYPKVEKAANTNCPITGEAIKKGSPTVLLQGKEIALCCEDCIEKAKGEAQATLAKALNGKLKDVGNSICPVTDKEVQTNVIALVGESLVRLSSSDCVERLKEDPARYLAKAKESAAKDAKSKAEKKGSAAEKPGEARS